MTITGFAGDVVGFLILLTAYVIMIAGIICIWNYLIIQYLFTWMFKGFRNYETLLDFIWHRKEFKKWWRERQEKQRELEERIEREANEEPIVM